ASSTTSRPSPSASSASRATTTPTAAPSSSPAPWACATSAPTPARTASTASTGWCASSTSPSPSTRTGRRAATCTAGTPPPPARLGTCRDTAPLIRGAQAPFNRRPAPAQQVRAMGARNFGLHLKDHDNQTRQDVVFGRGALDVPAVLRALREVRFQGYISIE